MLLRSFISWSTLGTTSALLLVLAHCACPSPSALQTSNTACSFAPATKSLVSAAPAKCCCSPAASPCGLVVTDHTCRVSTAEVSRYAIKLDRPWTVHWPILLFWIPFEVHIAYLVPLEIAGILEDNDGAKDS